MENKLLPCRDTVAGVLRAALGKLPRRDADLLPLADGFLMKSGCKRRLLMLLRARGGPGKSSRRWRIPSSSRSCASTSGPRRRSSICC
eukprot:14362024-Alexandrium_andersonii.AAC.1